MRRRRLMFRSGLLVLTLAAAVVLTVAAAGEAGFGLTLVAIALYIVAIPAATRLVAAWRDPAPDVPPPGRWWICELGPDHRLVRVAGPQESDPTWRCARCGHVQHQPAARSIADSFSTGEQGWVTRHDDL